MNSSLIGWKNFLQSGGGVVLFLHVGLELVRSLSLVQSKKNCQIKFLKQIGRQLELDKFSLAQFFLAVSDSPKFCNKNSPTMVTSLFLAAKTSFIDFLSLFVAQ